GHSDGGGSGGDAGQRSAGALPGRHAQRAFKSIRESFVGAALAGGAGRSASQAALPGRRVVCAGGKQRPGEQGTVHAAAAIKGTGQAPEGLGEDGTDPRSTAAQTGRGQKPVSGRLAFGRHSNARRRSGNWTAPSHLPVAQGQAAPSAAAGRAVSSAQQSECARTGEALAVLHSTHASGSGLQRSQGRPEPAPHFPL